MSRSGLPVLLMLGMVAAVAIAVSALLLSSPEPVRPAVHAMRSSGDADAWVLENRGGPLLTSDVELAVRIDGVLFEVDEAALSQSIGSTWKHGEELCVVGSDATCLFLHGQDVRAHVAVPWGSIGTFVADRR